MLLVCAPLLDAQPRGRVPPNLVTPGKLDQEEGRAVIEAFRSARYAHDYSFMIELRHYPRRGAAFHSTGQLWGSWNHIGPVSRVRLHENTEVQESELIVQNGPADAGWVARLDPNDGDPGAEFITGDAIHDALLPGLAISAFDLQMPFIYWEDYVYEGPDRVRGRPAHHFLLYPPADDPNTRGVGAVRVTLDAAWNAMLRAQVVDDVGTVAKTIQVISVRRVDDQWIARTIDVIDEHSRDKTRLLVHGARMDLRLPSDFFDPRTQLPREPGPDWDTFQAF